MRDTLRAHVFRKLLRSMEGGTPAWFQRFELQILLDLTAQGFGVQGERILHLPPGQALEVYARFTVQASSAATAPPEHLYRRACTAGYRIRQITGFTDSADLERLVFFLYRNIGITMRGQLPGKITVPDCYFARCYTPAQCRVMSRVDAGIIAGICGGGRLRFTQRITEGCGCCRACFARSNYQEQLPGAMRRMAEQQSSRAAEQQSSKAAEQQSSKNRIVKAEENREAGKRPAKAVK